MDNLDKLTISDLKTLIEKQIGLCISIYMPTHRAGAETQQDPIRLKNLLGEAEEKLLSYGLRAPEMKKLLKPAQELLDNSFFWQQQSDGLAIFLSSKISRCYRLPFGFEDLIVVTRRFHLKPLFPFFSGNISFNMLALSKNKVRLFQGNRYTINEIELEGVPKNLAEALKYDDLEKQLQFHTRTPRASEKRAAIFYGHGVGKDEAKDNILRYFRQIDLGLKKLFTKEKTPLVFAGVDYLFSLYREANSYPYLLDSGITGNPDELKAEELHKRAWEIVEPIFQKSQEESISQYKQLAGTGRTSCDLKEILPRAYQGQVDKLFVALGIQKWGTFDPRTSRVLMHQEPEPEDGDLLDLAAIHTLLNRGTVFAIEPEKMPDNASLTVIFRY
jgi:hypothetical protein